MAVARGGVMRLKPRPAAPPAPGKYPPPLRGWLQARKLLGRTLPRQAWNVLEGGTGAPLQGIVAGYGVWHGDRNKFFRQAVDNRGCRAYYSPVQCRTHHIEDESS